MDFRIGLSGPIIANQLPRSSLVHHCSPDQELQELLSKFWSQEEIPITDRQSLSPEEEECEQHFLSTHSRDVSGRYIVRIPLKSDPSTLGDSKTKALGCLTSLNRRLLSDLRYSELYYHFLEEYLSLGHMKLAPTSRSQSSAVYYLPHHGVLRESSITTKLRVVFNGSSRTSNITSRISLNDILHTGAKLQTDIVDVLLWIRTHQVLFSTDVEKMYRQIAIHKEDWDLQRILWFDKQNRPAAYQLTTVTYGLNCAPFLALRAMQQLVHDEGDRFLKAVPSLTKGRYVDDIFGGADTVSEAAEIIRQFLHICKQIPQAGQFSLQKWNSNFPDLIPDNTQTTTSSVEIEPIHFKILGLPGAQV